MYPREQELCMAELEAAAGTKIPATNVMPLLGCSLVSRNNSMF